MESNVPATTEQPSVPALPEAAVEQTPPPRAGQNITTGLFPLALAVLVLVFLALAVWTVMATTGSGL